MPNEDFLDEIKDLFPDDKIEFEKYVDEDFLISRLCILVNGKDIGLHLNLEAIQDEHAFYGQDKQEEIKSLVKEHIKQHVEEYRQKEV